MSKTISLMFIKASIIYFLVGSAWGAVLTFPQVHGFLEAGPAGMISAMHSHWLLFGWVSLAAMGAIYYLVPVIVDKELYSERLAKAHFWTLNLLIIIGVILGITASYLGGALFLEERFAEIGATIGPYMMLLAIVSVIGAIVPNALFAYVVYKTITRK